MPGPPQYLIDLSLMKQFLLPNEHKLELRWAVFNVPNYSNFRLPEEMIDLPTAGIITEAGAPRRMQVALKYIF